MKPTVYIETTIIGYLAMRVSGVFALRRISRPRASGGTSLAIRFAYFPFRCRRMLGRRSGCFQERLAYVQRVPLLEIPNEVNALADALLSGVPLPEKAAIDALHISVAAVNGVEYC